MAAREAGVRVHEVPEVANPNSLELVLVVERL